MLTESRNACRQRGEILADREEECMLTERRNTCLQRGGIHADKEESLKQSYIKEKSLSCQHKKD